MEYHLLLAKDLQFIPASLHEELAADTIEIEPMLTALIQKLTAESRSLTACGFAALCLRGESTAWQARPALRCRTGWWSPRYTSLCSLPTGAASPEQ
jgi:hypothetical protein